MINKQRAEAEAEAEQSNGDKNNCQGSRHALNVITKSNVCERVRKYVCAFAWITTNRKTFYSILCSVSY